MSRPPTRRAPPAKGTRFTPGAAAAFRAAIEDAGGIEVFAVGTLDRDGLVCEIEVHCRGNRGAVPALLRAPVPGQVVIHNHPSGRLEASDADMALAGMYGDDGIGMVITDNGVGRALWVVEPHATPPRVMVDEAELRAFFDDALPGLLPGWEPREGQLEMARAVLGALNDGTKESPVVAAVEAGTGTGKSLAYLVPAALWARANRGRVAIATYTITLQGQLAASDLPLLDKAGLETDWSVLQGRGNYICRRRLEEALAELEEEEEPATDSEAIAIRQAAEWAADARRGSRADMGFPLPDDAWERIRSDHDQTLRARCPHYGRCFYYEARRDAARARIVVVNQHLLLADLLVKKQTGGDGILPRFDRVVIDEGHHLEDAATGLMACELTARAVTRALAPLLPRKRGRRRGALGRALKHYAPRLDGDPGAQLTQKLESLEAELQLLRSAIPDELEALSWAVEERAAAGAGGEAADLRITQDLRGSPWWHDRAGPVVADLGRRLDHATEALAALDPLLRELPEEVILRQPQPLLDLRRARHRLSEKSTVAASMGQEDAERVQWIGPSAGRRAPHSATLASAPVEVGPALVAHLFGAMESTVLTSATLTVHGRFEHLLGRLGLEAQPSVEAERLQRDAPTSNIRLRSGVFPSPFDFGRQALLALPKDFPPPQDRRFLPWARRFTTQAIKASGGGVFVLCTSHALVADLHAAARAELGDRFLLLRQGEAGQRHLLQRFRTRQDAVLFGTDSFWEGVSVSGSALRLVLIPRLPFRVPTEPVQQARHERLEQRGQDPFRALSLPQAVLRLRQGFGRLVRTQTDRGAVVILDRRIHERWYGRVFLQSLPPARRAVGPSRAVLDQLREFFAEVPLTPPGSEPGRSDGA